MEPSKKKKLTVADREAIINALKNGESKDDVCERYGIVKSTINRIIAKGKADQTIEKKAVKSTKKLSPQSALNDALINWISKKQSEGKTITGTMITNKALKYAEKLKITKFKASKSWLTKFKSRHSLNIKTVSKGSFKIKPKDMEIDDVDNGISFNIQNMKGHSTEKDINYTEIDESIEQNHESVGEQEESEMGQESVIEQSMVKWYKKRQQKGLDINNTIIRERAEKYANKLGLNNFEPTKTWLKKFKATVKQDTSNIQEETTTNISKSVISPIVNEEKHSKTSQMSKLNHTKSMISPIVNEEKHSKTSKMPKSNLTKSMISPIANEEEQMNVSSKILDLKRILDDQPSIEEALNAVKVIERYLTCRKYILELNPERTNGYL